MSIKNNINNGGKLMFKKIIIKIFPKLIPQIQNALQILSMINKKHISRGNTEKPYNTTKKKDITSSQKKKDNQ